MPNKLRNIIKTFSFFAVIVAVAGCTVGDEIKETIKEDAKKINALKDNVGKGGGDPYSVDTVQSKDEIWLGDKSTKVTEGDPLPSKLENDDSIVLISGRIINFIEIAGQITELTGIPVKLDDLIIEKVREELEDSGSEEDTLTEGGAAFGMAINYSGKLSGLLNLLSSRFNLWWTYKNGTIEFSEMETRVFLVYALPVSTTMNSSIGGTSSASGDSSESTAMTSASMTSVADTALWAQINTSIQGMLPEEATLSIAPASGSVTVTASPNTLRKVSKFIRDLNEKLSRQVAISVKVLQVTLSDSENYGLDLNVAFNNGDFNITGQGPFISSTGDAGAGFSIIDPTSKFDGTSAFIKALSETNKVSTVTTSSVTTLNNKVAPVQVAKSITYIDSMTSTQNDTGGPTVTVTQATINSGFTMEILPRILDHGRVLMMVAMTLTELTALNEVVLSDGNLVQQPEVETRGFIQEIAMKSGSTLVLSGFEQMGHQGNQAGIGFAENPIGGNTNSERDRVALVVLLTPKVLVSPLSPETRVSGM